MKQHLLACGVDRAFVRRMTEGPDNLRSPLRPTREASLRDDRAALLLRLLFCGESVRMDLASSDLLVRDGDSVRCPYHVRFVRDLLLASDYLDGRPDAVMGAGETTAILYEAARPARHAGSALDLGCGAGTLALLLAADCDAVVGTDINERAAMLGRRNAELNGIGNVEFVSGDLYEAVEGRQFDLIVSQPPYYPGTAQQFLHGGARGDEIAWRAVEGIPRHLAPGGRAILFVSWPDDRGPVTLPGFDVLEIYADRDEIAGTRQSLSVFQHGPGRSLQFEVSAEAWGFVDAAHIDGLFRVMELLEASDEELRHAELCLPPRSSVFHEGDRVILRCPELLGCVPLTQEEWRALREQGDLAFVRTALRRGLLRVSA